MVYQRASLDYGKADKLTKKIKSTHLPFPRRPNCPPPANSVPFLSITSYTDMKIVPLLISGAIVATNTVLVEAFAPGKRALHASAVSTRTQEQLRNSKTFLAASSGGDDDKFSFVQRIESVKCAVVGALAGGIALTPFAAFHDILFNDPLVTNGVAQWEFDTDMGSLEAALFAIVYRYCIREDENDMLNQGAVGAFVFVRTLSRIQVPVYATAAPLTVGDPLGYFDWNMLQQASLSGLESAALFGGAALAMDYAFEKGFIGKFR